jgi:uncharacterized membrane protein
MINKSNSLISKGWLIIGIVLLVTGFYQLFIVNSLFYESAQLENIGKVQDNIKLFGWFLIISSFIIIIIGVIMIVECIQFSRFLKRFANK